MGKVLTKWKKIIKDYETPTVLKERLLKPYFMNLKIKEPILDLGCGTGYFTEILAKRGFNIVGFDQNPVKIKSKVKYFKGDASKTNLKEKFFSSILLVNVLSCVDSPQKRIEILAESKRIKKDKGKIYVVNTSESLFNQPTNSNLLMFKKLNSNKVLISVKKVDNSKIEFEDYIITKEDMKKYALKAKLKLLKTKDFIDKEMKRKIYTLYILE